MGTPHPRNGKLLSRRKRPLTCGALERILGEGEGNAAGNMRFSDASAQEALGSVLDGSLVVFERDLSWRRPGIGGLPNAQRGSAQDPSAQQFTQSPSTPLII